MSVIWQLAKSNKKLLPSIYHNIRKVCIKKGLLELLDIKGQKDFIKAFHSENTTAEIRAVLLNMTFNPALDINVALQPYNRTHSDFTKNHIRFSAIKTGDHYSIRTSTPLSKFAKPISMLQIQKSRYDKLLYTMNAKTLKEARFVYWIDEYKHGWYTLVDQFRTTIKANDVLKKYYDYDKSEEQKDYDRHPSTPDYKIERFLNDLEHIKGQLYKFNRLQGYLGWDVSNIFQKLDAVTAKANEIYNMPEFSVEEQLEQQYVLFDMMSDTISDIVDHLSMVDNTPYEEIEQKIPKTFALPQFIHYNPYKAHIYRHKMDTGSFQKDITRIKNFFLNRGAIW